MTTTVAMLNHPSTKPNMEREAYFPHIRMTFTLRRQPLVSPFNETIDATRFAGVTVVHPNNPEIDFVVDMPMTAQVVFTYHNTEKENADDDSR